MFATLPLELGRRESDTRTTLAAAQQGDRDAQASLFELHHDSVARQILRMTGDAGSVDDLAQEVFIAAFRRLGDFRGEAKLETWLHRIAVNKVRNWWDATSRRRNRETAATVTTTATDCTTPELVLSAADKLNKFYDLLADLPEGFREAFVARVIEELSLEDASAVLGVPVSTVSYRARRAAAMLGAALGETPKGGANDE